MLQQASISAIGKATSHSLVYDQPPPLKRIEINAREVFTPESVVDREFSFPTITSSPVPVDSIHDGWSIEEFALFEKRIRENKPEPTVKEHYQSAMAISDDQIDIF